MLTERYMINIANLRTQKNEVWTYECRVCLAKYNNVYIIDQLVSQESYSMNCSGACIMVRCIIDENWHSRCKLTQMYQIQYFLGEYFRALVVYDIQNIRFFFFVLRGDGKINCIWTYYAWWETEKMSYLFYFLHIIVFCEKDK